MSVDAMLRIEREIAGTPEAVYDAFTVPEIVMQWWGPPGYEAPDCEIMHEVGGRWVIYLRSPEGNEMAVGGTYKVLERPRRIVMSWAWRQEDGSFGTETEVDVTLAASGNGTMLTLIHRHFETEEKRDQHNKGWTGVLDRLEQFFGA